MFNARYSCLTTFQRIVNVSQPLLTLIQDLFFDVIDVLLKIFDFFLMKFDQIVQMIFEKLVKEGERERERLKKEGKQDQSQRIWA